MAEPAAGAAAPEARTGSRNSSTGTGREGPSGEGRVREHEDADGAAERGAVTMSSLAAATGSTRALAVAAAAAAAALIRRGWAEEASGFAHRHWCEVRRRVRVVARIAA